MTCGSKKEKAARPDWTMLDEKKSSRLYRIVRWFIWLFSPKYRIEGAEKLPDEPCVIVGNHSQMYGPIAGELYTPRRHAVWCAGQMMNREEAAAYAYQDFWSGKPKGIRWFYQILSHLIVPLALLLFNNAHTIAVYHDMRLKTTFRESLLHLREGESLVIFPEHYQEHNNIVHEFQERFADLARYYYKETGKALCFVPVYIAPRLKTFFYGDPIRFRPDRPMAEERKRICGALMDEITRIALAQPEHVVIPYPNIPKKQYPRNTPTEDMPR